MSNMYKHFKTDKGLEEKGVIIDYGDFRVTVTRAAKSNKKFARVLRAKTKPYLRAIQTGTMDEGVGDKIQRETYTDSVILNWEVKNGKDKDGEDKWKVGIAEIDTSKILPFTAENVVKVLEALPDLFLDIQDQAQNVALFSEAILETDGGN